MDEIDRKQLLEAGKASLLAYQRKSKKRKRKNKDTTVDSLSENTADELSLTSEHVTSTQEHTSLHSGNVSPIPFDQAGVQDPLVSFDQQSLSTSLQVAKRANSADDENTNQPESNDFDNGNLLSREPVLEQKTFEEPNNVTKEYLDLTEPVLEHEKLEEPLLDFESYNQNLYTSSPVDQLSEATDGAKVNLSESTDDVKMLGTAEDNFEQILDDQHIDPLLDGSQEQVSGEFVLKEAAPITLDHRHVQQQQQEIETLKEKLNISLSSLKEVEQELLEVQQRHEQQLEVVNASHATELAKAHEQHRIVVEKLAAGTSAHSAVDTGITMQSQQLEGEMERLKVIKDSLKENYEREKNELQASLIKEHQEKMELFKQQAEENANSQLQEYHKQYLAAYEGQTKQKAEAEAALLQTLDAKELEYREKLSQLQERCNKLEGLLSQADIEKQLANEQVAALSKLHSDQLESMQLGKQELENHLKEQIDQWKSKAASLEQHLLSSNAEDGDFTSKESTEQLKSVYEGKLSAAILEKSHVETQFLSQINELNAELSREKEKHGKDTNSKIQQLTADLEKVGKDLSSKNAEIEEIQHQHEDALVKLQVSLTQTHELELTSAKNELQTVSNQLQTLSVQVTELNESKRDVLLQLEKTQHQLNNVQSSLAQSNEEKQQLITNVQKYQNQVRALESDFNTIQVSSAQAKLDFEKDANLYQAQINQLEATVNEVQSRELLLQTELKVFKEQNFSGDKEATAIADVLFTQLDSEILRKAKYLTSSNFTSSLELVNKLLASLESKVSEISSLQESKQTLALQLAEVQANIPDNRPNTTEVDLLHSYEQLQAAFEELTDSSNIQIENLKHEKQVLHDTLNEQLLEKEKSISELRKQLQTTDLASKELQDEFGRECAKYEIEKQSLEQTFKENMVPKDTLDSIVSMQTREVEEKFEKERQALVAKINEKGALEAELNTRKIELERKLAEKTKLEEVLFEKSRLEQELRAQKTNLEHELFEIEAKVKSRENEIQQERSDWSMKLSEKDSTIQLVQEKLHQQDEEFVVKEQHVKEVHDQEVNKLLADIEHSNLRTQQVVDNLKTIHAEEICALKSETEEKSIQALSELEAKLNTSHNEDLEELKEKHSVEVSSLAIRNKETIEKLTCELNAIKERELSNIAAEITAKHEVAITELTSQFEAKRQKELSTMKEVLGRQRNEALLELREQLLSEKQKALDACKLQCTYQCDLKLEDQRKQLEESHSLHLEEHEKGVSADKKMLMETELLKQKEMFEVKIHHLELTNSEALKMKTEEIQSELLVKHKSEIAALQEKFSTDIAESLHQKEIAFSKSHAEEIASMKDDFDARLALSVTAAEEKLSSKHQEDISSLQLSLQNKIMFYEDKLRNHELQNTASIENLQQQHENAVKVLQSQIAEMEKSLPDAHSVSYCEELKMTILAKDEVIKELSNSLNENKQHYETAVNDLDTKLKSLQEEYDKTCIQLKQEHASELQALEEKLMSQLSSGYKAKLSVLQLESEVAKQHVEDVHQQTITALVQQHEEEILNKEMQWEERIASLQAEHETKLNDIELQHISELESITSEFEQELKKRELEHQDLMAQFTSISATNKDYLNEIQLLETQLKRFSAGKSQDLQNLEQEIELLAKQNDTAIKLAEAKIANRYELLLTSKTKELEDQYITKLAKVQTERAIVFAQEMEQMKLCMNALSDDKLSEVVAAAKEEQQLALQSAQLKHEESVVELNGKWQLQMKQLEERLKNEYVLKMSALEHRMSEERSQQLLTLDENYENARDKMEADYKTEREKEQREYAEHVEKLKMRFAKEKAVAIDECNRRSSSLHAKEIAVLNAELKKMHESASALQAQLEESNTQIEQLRVDHQHQIEITQSDRHAELVQQHMAKFKDLTDKLIQKHHSEMEQQCKHLNDTHVAELENLHNNHQQEAGLLRSLLEAKERQLKDVQTFIQQFVSSELLEETIVMTRSVKHLAQPLAKDSQLLLQTIGLLEAKLGNIAHRFDSISHSVTTLNLTMQSKLDVEDGSFSAQTLLDSQILQVEQQKTEAQKELVKCHEKLQNTEAELVQRNEVICEVEKALEKEKEISSCQANEITELKKKLQCLLTEHSVDMSKLEVTTKEHADTTNTFVLMRIEMEQLRVEKLAAEQQLASLDSFIQACLQVLTTMNANVVQHLLKHLQSEVVSVDQNQPSHSQHQSFQPRTYSAEASSNIPKQLVSTPLDDKTVLMMQDSGLSSHQTTSTTLVSEAAETPKTEIVETPGPGVTSMTIYATQESMTDSTSSQNTFNPEELSIQQYEDMSGFKDNDSEEPIALDRVSVEVIICEARKLLESKGISASPSFLLSFPSTSGCVSVANSLKSSLGNVQELFLLLLQSFNYPCQEVLICKKQLAEYQSELLQANGELNQVLINHELQCSQHEEVVKTLEDEKCDCESRLQAANAKIKALQKQIQDSTEIISELETLIAQYKEHSTETGLKDEVTVQLEQEQPEHTPYIQKLEQPEHEEIKITSDDYVETESVQSYSTGSDSNEDSVDIVDDRTTLNIMNQLKVELTNNDEEIRQLKEEVEQQAQLIASVKESNLQLLSDNAVVSESNVALTANVQQLHDVVTERDENVRVLNERLNLLQSQSDAQQQTLSNKFSSLLHENKSLLADLASTREENDELNHALQQTAEATDQLRGELNSVLESNKSLISSLESNKTATSTQLAEKLSELKVAQQQLAQAQEELHLREKCLQKVERELANKSEEFKTIEEALEQMKRTVHQMQVNINELETELAEAKEGLLKCNNENDKLKTQCNSISDSHAEDLASLQSQHNQQIATLEKSFQQQVSELHTQHEAAQAELKLSNMQELACVTSQHNAALNELETSHAKQLAAIKLDHTEALLKQKEDLEALHTGQLSYMKLYATQEADSLEEEGDGDNSTFTADHTTADHTTANSISLLLKIAEIAPQLNKEVNEVRDLCLLSGQSLPTVQSSDDDDDDKHVLLEAIQSLSNLILQTSEATKPSAVEDWRKSLLDAVQQVLQKERDVLMAAVQSPDTDLSPDYQQLLQNQFANHATLLKELHASDRNSLLAEIQQLRALVESMRNEQRQQLQNLFEQVHRLQQLAEAEKNALRVEIHSLQDSNGQSSAEITKLRKDLSAECKKADNFVQLLKDAQQRNHELTSSIPALAKKNKELHDKLLKANSHDEQLQQALSKSEVDKTALLEQVGTLQSHLDKANSELVSAQSTQENLRQDFSKQNETLAKLEHTLKVEMEALIVSQQQITNSAIAKLNEKLHAANTHIQAFAVSVQGTQAGNAKLEAELEQANEKIEQMGQSLTQQVEESAQLQEELRAKRSALQEHDKHLKKLKRSITQQSENIEKLQSKTAAKSTQDQTLLANMQVLLKEKEEMLSHLNSTLQAKEAELTKNTDLLLREKVKCAELQEQMNICKQQLEETRVRELQNISQSKSLTDQYANAAIELNNAKTELASLEKERTELNLQVAALKKKLSVDSKQSKPEQNPQLTRVYKQLQSLLANELSKNATLRNALIAGNADGSDLIKMIEMLLHREEIHAVTQESLQIDKDQLEKEVRQLNKQISQLQTLLRSKQFGSPAKFSVSALQPDHSTDQGNSSYHLLSQSDSEAQHREHLLKQTLEDERLQVVLLKNQISTLEQKLEAFRGDARPTVSPISVDVSIQTSEINKQAEVKAHDAELIEIFLKYREAAERCKCLMYQKDYLVKQMNTFYQTEQAALIMIKEMGISVDWSTQPTIQRSSKSLTRFKVIAFVVLATVRLPLLCKRRQLRRSAVMSKRKKVIQYVVARTQRKQPLKQKDIPVKPSAHMPAYKPPVAASHLKKPSFGLESYSQSTLQSTDSPSECPSVPIHDFESAFRSDAVSFTPIKLTSQATKQHDIGTVKSGKVFPEDPQVNAYLQGLEKLQARLKKM